MKKFIFLLVSFPLFSSAQETVKPPNLIFSFSEVSGYTYFLPTQQVRAGYSARLIADGLFVGSVITPNEAEVDVNDKLKKIFEELLAADKRNLENLSQLKKTISEQVQLITGTQQGTTSPAPSQPLQAPVEKLDWDAYAVCAQKIIPFLKQSVVLFHKTKTDPSLLPSYYLTKSLVDELSDKNGVACGQHLGPGLDLQLSGHIRNIKVLIALLKRTHSKERKILLQTLVGAFSKQAPLISANQFAYYFARQFFVAAVTSDEIPQYESLNRELKSSKTTQTYESTTPGIGFRGSVVTEYKDIDANFNTGMNFVRRVVK